MPTRPTDLIDLETPDNTTTVASSTVRSEGEFFTPLTEVASPELGEGGITSFSDSALITTDSIVDTPGVGFGTENGYVAVVSPDYNSDLYFFDQGDTDAVESVAVAQSGQVYWVDSTGEIWTSNRQQAVNNVSPTSITTISGSKSELQQSEVFTTNSDPDMYVAQESGLSNEVYRINDNGLVWTYVADGPVVGAIQTAKVSDTEEEVYFTDKDGRLYSLKGSDASERWKSTYSGGPSYGRIEYDQNNVYVQFAGAGAGSGDLISVERSTGDINWSIATDQVARSAVFKTSDGLVVYPSVGGGQNIELYDPTTGELKEAESGPDGVVATFQPGDPLPDEPPNDYTGVVSGSSLYATAPSNDNSGDNFFGYFTLDLSQHESVSLNNDPEKSIGSINEFVGVGTTGSNGYLYDTTTTGVLGPVKVGSRPSLGVGSLSFGDYDVEVYGADTADRDISDNSAPDPFLQDTVGLEARSDAEQVPWWPWKYVQLRLADDDATAGDVDLVVSASR
jgi:hypothetical protein